MPKSSLIVLISAKKVAEEKAQQFNFEAVYKKYSNFNKNRDVSIGFTISKQVFLKIFLDLVDKGFLRSEHMTDIVSVNNKLSIGFRLKDFDDMLTSTLDKLDLPVQVKNWVQQR